MSTKIEKTENIHIVLWLLKDICWVLDIKWLGLIMIIPTLLVAIWLTIKSKENKSDLFHNAAVCCWISANSIWMIGEFFFKDTLRPYAAGMFVLGLVLIAVYYLVYAKKQSREAEQN
jgi:hypothetical protein